MAESMKLPTRNYAMEQIIVVVVFFFFFSFKLLYASGAKYTFAL